MKSMLRLFGTSHVYRQIAARECEPVMIRRLFGCTAMVTAAIALLLSTLTGTANAGTAVITVSHLNALFVPILGCTANYAVVAAGLTIDDPVCPGASYVAINALPALSDVTIYNGNNLTAQTNGLVIQPIYGPIKIVVPPGLV
jgi:hypothetical protein